MIQTHYNCPKDIFFPYMRLAAKSSCMILTFHPVIFFYYLRGAMSAQTDPNQEAYRADAERAADLSELLGHVNTSWDNERRALSRQLHDSLGTSLTAQTSHQSLLTQKMPQEAALLNHEASAAECDRNQPANADETVERQAGVSWRQCRAGRAGRAICRTAQNDRALQPARG